MCSLLIESLWNPGRLSNYFKDTLREICSTSLKYATVTAALWWGLGSNLCLSSSLCNHGCQVASASSQRPPPVCHEGIKPHRPRMLPLVAQKKSVCRDEMASALGNMNYCCHQHIASPWYWTFDIETVCLCLVTIFVIYLGLAEVYRFIVCGFVETENLSL